MTTNPHPFREFSDVIEFYDAPSTGTSTHSPTTKNNSRCLQCQREISLSRYSPYCSENCMNNRDKGIKVDHKGSEKNVLLGFSKVFEQ